MAPVCEDGEDDAEEGEEELDDGVVSSSERRCQ